MRKHLDQRGFDSIEDAVRADDQDGSFAPSAFRDGLAESLESGKFRLVIVLDDAPPELAVLVGYLESMTPDLQIDLITVSAYDVGGTQVIVPQRVDPERVEAELSTEIRRPTSQTRYVPGTEEFKKTIDFLPDSNRPTFNKIVQWAERLESAGAAHLSSTIISKEDQWILRPLIPGFDSGLITVWQDTDVHIGIYRSAFKNACAGYPSRHRSPPEHGNRPEQHHLRNHRRTARPANCRLPRSLRSKDMTATRAADANRGHAAHTKAAEDQSGLPGEIYRPINVTVIGAGSMFTPRLMNDILRVPGAESGRINLVDLDPERLGTMRQLIERLVEQLGRGDGWTVNATTDRREALAGSDFIVVTIEVSGLDCVRFDNDIPAKYGVDQCIGDTIGPGGLFKGLRTIPVFLDILADAEELCPNALVLNYTNPMNMLCLAAARRSGMRVVGLCHSVQGTGRLLAGRAGVDYAKLDWRCAGINHLAWFTTLEHDGEDLYPLLFEKARNDLAGDPADPDDAGDLVRKDMMLNFGAFITESSGHLSEYLPYYRTRTDSLARYCREGYEGGSSFYADGWPSWRAEADESRRRMLAGDEPMDWDRSFEYASWIVEAVMKNSEYFIHGNVPNQTPDGGLLIGTLPAGEIIEVECLVNGDGVTPLPYGELPPQMAAICRSNMAVFELGVAAALERSKEPAIHALMLDPLTAACCPPADIREMTLELFDAEKDFLPAYR
jgi:alpha-galactosidase